jgi:hypothetical protein
MGLKSWASGLAMRVACVAFVVGVIGAVAGCGDGPAPVTTMVESASANRLTEVGQVFVDLARSVAPMPVYGVSELPDEVTVPPEWWPAVDCDTPSDYEGPVVLNPRVSIAGEAEPEIQLLLSHPDGWLVVVENFRGDLGDVSGERVGSVDGNVATLYTVNGGLLVQWSVGGRWYGVFGRGVSKEYIVQIALEMRPVDATDAQ